MLQRIYFFKMPREGENVPRGILGRADWPRVCLRTKGMPEPIAMFNIDAVGQVYNQTKKCVYLGGNVNHIAHVADPFGRVCGAHVGPETAEVREKDKTPNYGSCR